jgi:hypothetical protein
MRRVKSRQFRWAARRTLDAWLLLVSEGKASELPYQLHDLFSCITVCKRDGSCPCGATLDTPIRQKEQNGEFLKGNVRGGQHMAAVARLVGLRAGDLEPWIADLANRSGYFTQLDQGEASHHNAL